MTPGSVDLLQPYRDPLTASTSNRIMSSHSHHGRTAKHQGSFSSSNTGGGEYDSSLAAANRLSTMDASQNENNVRLSRRPSALSGVSAASSSAVTDAPTTTAWPKDFGSTPSSQAASSQRSAAALHCSKSDVDNGSTDIVIEEKRRRVHGDGYSVHRYLRGRMLGKGGFAKVFLCTALDTNKNYAVKIVPKANLVKARARQKLQAEIKIHRTLKHENICEYKHFFEDRDNCYILLELCHNQSMNEMIKRRKQLTEPEAIYFMGQILAAVQYMHDNNVIHRDLKLGNLFLDKNLNIKVGDLGLATRLEDAEEKRKTICGTPNYIAPEIIQGDKAKRGHSFEVDVWSMGVVLYTVLVGKPPYEAKDVKSTYQRILKNEYSFPKHVEISEYAKDLIRTMLQSNPADRPSLSKIGEHPFLTKTLIPAYIPTSATHDAPAWHIDESGDIAAADKDFSSRRSSSSSRKPALPRSSSGRQPFGSYNPNLAKAAAVAATKEKPTPRDGIDMQGIVKNALAMAGSTMATATASGFKIFDESAGQSAAASSVAAAAAAAASAPLERQASRQLKASPQPFPSEEELLVARTHSLSISTPVQRKMEAANTLPTASSSSPSKMQRGGSDAEVLQRMVDGVETVIDITDSRKGTYNRPQTPKPLSRGGPAKWVTRYVDYTSKYGLGFLLNDASSGVYFNDSTKTALEPDGETFQYIERTAPTETQRGGKVADSTTETFTLSSYPESLKKKVTLLKHFRNYLLEQQKKADEDDSVMPSSVNAVAPTDLVYVKKWVRTKHAILFRMSDQTIQIVFYDQTEILLTPDDSVITYVNKNRNRLTYTFTDELIGNHAELGKRLKYTKEILQQLVPTQHRN